MQYTEGCTYGKQSLNINHGTVLLLLLSAFTLHFAPPWAVWRLSLTHAMMEERQPILPARAQPQPGYKAVPRFAGSLYSRCHLAPLLEAGKELPHLPPPSTVELGSRAKQHQRGRLQANFANCYGFSGVDASASSVGKVQIFRQIVTVQQGALQRKTREAL